MTTPRPPEAAAFLEALDSTPPATLSACVGWTAHEVTAHLAAGAAEVSRHLDPFLGGEAVPATRSFEAREAPYRAMDDRSLRQRLDTEEHKMRMLVDQVLASDPAAVIPWTGRQMPVAKFAPHMASELAIHHWISPATAPTGCWPDQGWSSTPSGCSVHCCCIAAPVVTPIVARTSPLACVATANPTSGSRWKRGATASASHASNKTPESRGSNANPPPGCWSSGADAPTGEST